MDVSDREPQVQLTQEAKIALIPSLSGQFSRLRTLPVRDVSVYHLRRGCFIKDEIRRIVRIARSRFLLQLSCVFDAKIDRRNK